MMLQNSIGNSQTPISFAPPRIDYKWSHPAGDADKNLWGNVEFVSI